MPADFIDDLFRFIRSEWILIIVFGLLEWGFDQIKFPIPYLFVVQFVLIGLAIPVVITQLKGKVSYKRMLGYVVFSLCVYAAVTAVLLIPTANQVLSEPQYAGFYGNGAYAVIVMVILVITTGILFGAFASVFVGPASLVGLAIIKRIGWRQNQPAKVK